VIHPNHNKLEKHPSEIRKPWTIPIPRTGKPKRLSRKHGQVKVSLSTTDEELEKIPKHTSKSGEKTEIYVTNGSAQKFSKQESADQVAPVQYISGHHVLRLNKPAPSGHKAQHGSCSGSPAAKRR